MSTDPIAAFQTTLAEAGLEPGEIIADGRLHRCPVAGKPHGQDGAYCLHLDAPASGFWQNWRAGTFGKWTAKGDRDMSPAEREALRRRAEADRKARQREQDRRHAEAADRARSILAAAPACPKDHAYLTRKGIPPLGGVRLGTDGALLLPLEDERGEVQGLQRITPDGAKRFLSGTKKAGSFAVIPAVIPGDSGRLFLVEGYATGASVHLATGGTVLVCLDCGNLMAVARIARRRYPKRKIVIAGDNDHGTEGNPGLTKAREAAQAIGGLLAVPSFSPGEPGTDWNDLHTAKGLDAVRDGLALAASPASPSPAEVPEAVPPAPEPPDLRPVIEVLPGETVTLADRCEELLLASPLPVFQRGGQLVRVASLPEPSSLGGVSRPAGSLVLTPVAATWLTDAWGRLARFVKPRKNGTAPVDPPVAVASALLARKGDWRFPALRGILASPALRPDGTVLNAPGYDPATAYYLAEPLPLDLPAAPGRDDALAAVAKLRGLLAGFPFVAQVDESVALGLLLSAVSRPAFGRAPLFAVTAPVRGSGKSTLVDLAAILATGSRAAVLAATSNMEELEKRLAASILAGDSLVSLDNLNGALRSDLLSQALTQGKLRVRPLGSSEQVELSCDAVWSATGNGLAIGGDLSRRALMCRLDPEMERPETRRFEFDPLARCQERRAEYVSAALTALRAFHLAGRPGVSDLEPFGSFEAWSGLVRAALVWLGLPDPCLSRAEVEAEDPDREILAGLLAAWREYFKDTPQTSAMLISAAMGGTPALVEYLGEIAADGSGYNARRLGRWLAANKGRVVGGLRLKARRQDRKGFSQWTVEAVPAK